MWKKCDSRCAKLVWLQLVVHIVMPSFVDVKASFVGVKASYAATMLHVTCELVFVKASSAVHY